MESDTVLAGVLIPVNPLTWGLETPSSNQRLTFRSGSLVTLALRLWPSSFLTVPNIDPRIPQDRCIA